MKSHRVPKSGQNCLFVLFRTILIVCSFGFPSVSLKAQQPPIHIRPEPFTELIPSPFPLIEDAELRKFDALPAAERAAKLASNGPLLPMRYKMNNFSMRVLLKGNSSVVIDYAMHPKSNVLITFSVENAEHRGTLTERDSVVDEILDPRTILRGLPPNASLKVKTAAVAVAVITELVRNPKKARRHVVTIELPSSFGERPQPGKLSFQAFTSEPNDPTNSQPAYFRLYGLALVNRETGRTNIDPENKIKSSHRRGSRLVFSGEGSTAIDQIMLEPNTIKFGKGKIKYQIHSLSAFNSVKAVFYRIQESGEDASSNEVAHTVDLGPITKNGWLKPPQCTCDWDGTGHGGPSRGLHDMEVRAWLGLETGEWVSGWSDPKRVRIK